MGGRKGGEKERIWFGGEVLGVTGERQAGDEAKSVILVCSILASKRSNVHSGVPNANSREMVVYF